MAGTTPIEIPLNGSAESKPHPLLREPTTLTYAANARHLSGPGGTLERMPGPAETTTITGDAQAVLPAGGDVLVANSAHGYYVHQRRKGTGTPIPAEAAAAQTQPTLPCVVTGGGVLFAGAHNDTVIGAHTTLRNGVLVGIYTVRRRQEDSAGATRGVRYFTVVTVRDEVTGERVVEDEIVQDFDTTAAPYDVRRAISLGAVPVMVSSEECVAVWWAEHDTATPTGWVVKHSLVNVNSDADLNIGSAVTAYTSTSKFHGIAVTGSVSGAAASSRTYCARTRSSDDRIELYVWDHETDTAVNTSSVTATATAHTGPVTSNHAMTFGRIDIAVANDKACAVFTSANGGAAGSLCQAIQWSDADGATPVEDWSLTAILPQTNALCEYISISVAAQDYQPVAGDWNWVIHGTEEDAILASYFPNPTAAVTKRVRIHTALVDLGGAGTAQISQYNYALSVRGFTPRVGAVTESHAQAGFSKLAREFHATDAMQGTAAFYPSPPVADASIPEPDPSVEICGQWTPGAAEHLLAPVARIGVDRAVNPKRSVQWLWSGSALAKPLAVDGETFAIAYLADPQSPFGPGANVRWARVDYAGAPSSLETRDGTTYIAGGSLHAWDGKVLQECTPLPLPRMRTEVKAWGAGTNLPAGAYILNAIYYTRDASGVVRRSQPFPVDCTYTSGGSVKLAAFVEIPLTAYSGTGTQHIGCEVYASDTNGTTLYLVADRWYAATSIAEAGGEFEFEVDYSKILTSNTIAYWQAGELIHTAPPAMLDLAEVGDLVVGLAGEERIFRFTKPRQAGSDAQIALEWPAANEIPIPGKGTAVEELAERPLMFTEDAAWTVYGVGPDKLGVGSYSPATRVANIGAVDHRLVARIPAGVVFKSKRGWWLMGKDYSLTPFAAGYEDLLGYASRIVAMPEFSELRFSLGGVAGIHIYNWDRGAWTHTGDTAVDEAVTGGRLFSLTRDGTGTFTVSYDYSSYASREVMLETNWIQPAGVEGDVHAETFSVTAERAATHDLQVTVWTDYDQSGAGTVYTFTNAQLAELAKDDIYTAQESLEHPKARAYKFRIEEINAAQNPAAAFRPIKLTLHVRKISAKAETYQRKA